MICSLDVTFHFQHCINNIFASFLMVVVMLSFISDYHTNFQAMGQAIQHNICWKIRLFFLFCFTDNIDTSSFISDCHTNLQAIGWSIKHNILYDNIDTSLIFLMTLWCDYIFLSYSYYSQITCFSPTGFKSWSQQLQYNWHTCSVYT